MRQSLHCKVQRRWSAPKAAPQAALLRSGRSRWSTVCCSSVEGNGSVAVYAISDLHTDHAANLEWVQQLSAPPTSSVAGHINVLIVAGDISHNLDVLRLTLQLLRERYDRVVFVAGNHSLWLGGGDSSGAHGDTRDSVAKLAAVLRVCGELGVDTEPLRIGQLWVVPILSWHHKDWDREPDIPGVPGASALIISDYKACSWPADVPGGGVHGSRQLAEWFDALNEAPGTARAASWAELWACMAGDQGGGSCGDSAGAVGSGSRGGSAAASAHDRDAGGRGFDVISFSHFLPHQELLPEKRFLSYPPLAKAVGSVPLAERLRRLQPAVHVFGHSHFAWDARLGATRYVQAPLCYPRERERRGRSIRISAAAADWRQWQEAEVCTPASRRAEQAIAVGTSSEGQGGHGGGGGGGGGRGGDSSTSSRSSSGEAVPAPAGGGFTSPGETGGWEARLPALLYTARFSNNTGSTWSAQWAPSLEGMWSDYYANHPREPENTTLAPWVAARYERRRRRLTGSSSLSSGSETEAE